MLMLDACGNPWDHIVLPRPSHQWRVMSIRIRKLIGAVALIVLVTVWALLAMAIAQFPPIFNNWWVAAIYYVVAGMGWVLPAMPLIRWMSGLPLRSR
jgi:hypothetical protein